MRTLPKILLVTVRSDEGGGPKLVNALTNQLANTLQSSFEVYVASPLDSPYGSSLRERAKAHFRLRHRKWSLKSLFALRQFCRANKIDLIHAHGFGAGLFARFLGLPVVYQPHGTHAPNNWSAKLKLTIEKVLLRFTDAVIFISESEKLQAADLGLRPRFSSVVANPLLGLPVLRETTTAGSTSLVFGNLARIDPIKQHVALIELFNDFVSKDEVKRDVRLLIMGGGDGRATVDDAVRSSRAAVEVLPFSGDPYRFLSRLDVFVSASRSEGFGLAVLEAMACGVPCLISQVPGHNEFIEKRWAVGFEVSSPDSFRAGASKILTGGFRPPDPDLVKLEYSPERWVTQISQVYRTVLDRPTK